MTDINIQGLMCPYCKDVVHSRHVHDFRHCSCEYCFVDGGKDYFRCGWGGKKFKQPWIVPQSVKILGMRFIADTVKKKEAIK